MCVYAYLIQMPKILFLAVSDSAARCRYTIVQIEFAKKKYCEKRYVCISFAVLVVMHEVMLG